MNDLFELVVSAAAAGGIYSLIALAYLLILRPTGIINFAVGEWAMIGAFMGVAVLTELLAEAFALPYIPGVILVLAGMAFIGWLVEFFTVRRPLGIPQFGRDAVIDGGKRYLCAIARQLLGAGRLTMKLRGKRSSPN